MIAIDTNYIVRFLVNDIESLQKIATKIIQESDQIYISPLTIAECVYVLMKHYQKEKNKVANTLIEFLKFTNIDTPNSVKNALRIFQNENINIYDTLIMTEALSKGYQFKTFDKKLHKIYIKYLN